MPLYLAIRAKYHCTTSVTVYLWLRYISSSRGIVTSIRSRSIAVWEPFFAVAPPVVCAVNDVPATVSTARNFQNPTRIFMRSFREIDGSYENTGPLASGSFGSGLLRGEEGNFSSPR